MYRKQPTSISSIFFYFVAFREMSWVTICWSYQIKFCISMFSHPEELKFSKILVSRCLEYSASSWLSLYLGGERNKKEPTTFPWPTYGCSMAQSTIYFIFCCGGSECFPAALWPFSVRQTQTLTVSEEPICDYGFSEKGILTKLIWWDTKETISTHPWRLPLSRGVKEQRHISTAHLRPPQH